MSPLFDLEASSVQVSDGWLTKIGSPSIREHYIAIVDRHPGADLTHISSTGPGEEMHHHGFDSFGAHFVEVLVDEQTGHTTVSR